jgi:CHAT domain-containing protein
MLDLHKAQKVWIGATIALIITAYGPVRVQAQNIPFVPPPRTITDITTILDGEKPDEAQIAARKANADAKSPDNLSAAGLAQFYYDRGNARALLARNREALADGLQALGAARGTPDYRQSRRIEQFIALQYRALGDLKNAKAMLEKEIREDEEAGAGYGITGAYRSMEEIFISLGELSQAEACARFVEARVQLAHVSPYAMDYARNGPAFETFGAVARALIFEARGQYPEAEASYRRAEASSREILKDVSKLPFPPPAEQILQGADNTLLRVALNEAKQGRLSEAEADARRALLEILKVRGKYSPWTPKFIIGLAGILVEQGRYEDAEKLARSGLDVQRTLGIADDTPESVGVLSQLGNILVLRRKMKDAALVYAQLDKAVVKWMPQQRDVFELNASRIVTLYEVGQVDAGIAAAERLVTRETSRTGKKSFDTATARGVLAEGYAGAGRTPDAIREFKVAIPILMTAAQENAEDDDPSVVAARRVRLQRIVEVYIGVLALSAKTLNDVAVETFGLADAVRGHTVKQALADSSIRVAAKNPTLAALIRSEQDSAKKISASFGTLNNLLALPSGQRDDQKVRAINAEIENLRADRKAALQQIDKQFPPYSDLIHPKPPTVDEIRAALRPGEALLSFYFGQDASFVWAVPKNGNVAFAVVPATALDLDAKVQALRKALEPQVIMVSDIPPFDLTLAYQLYSLLLKPVEAAWQPAKSLIVVTNGALGELPLSLLPTAPSQADANAKPAFAGYRDVPWLARSHAVTVIPSASTLVTLRHLPPGSPGRDGLIGFGDPYFNAQEAAEAEAEVQQSAPAQIASASEGDSAAATVARGVPLKLRASVRTEDVDTAELTMLPRLPDTRLELTSVADALGVDPAKALYLGKDANEQNVETLDLSHYRVVAFATHGLVPGDIDGLTQPALALTAPDVAGVKGDGLLTMEKILTLKLDADWVVLSACNTAAGAGAGAEAVSGLGSAFFYAGTRALLVTNWSVQSASARVLITDVFRRQSADPTLSRGEALRQAMMALLDGQGSVDAAGHTIFTYGHPLFWAPYSVIGDGGGT